MRYFLFVVMPFLFVATLLSLRVKFFRSSRSESVREVKVLTPQESEKQAIQSSLEKADSYWKAGQEKLAVETWKNLVRKHLNSSEIEKPLYLLMNFYIKKDQKSFVELYFRKLSESFSSEDILFPRALYEYANYLNSRGDRILARKFYKQLMKDFLFFEKRFDVQKKLEDLNMTLLFSKNLIEGTQKYVVKKGDSLSSIGDEFHTTVDFLMKANRLSSERVIHPGDILKVLNRGVNISLSIDKSQKVMLLLFNGEVFHRYFVAVGGEDKTPSGKFSVQNKLKDPVWFHAGQAIPSQDPRNVLGSRWIAFDKDLGIHGTIDKRNILLQTSNGCVRMTNTDVEQVYSLLRIGDSIVIVN